MAQPRQPATQQQADPQAEAENKRKLQSQFEQSAESILKELHYRSHLQSLLEDKKKTADLTPKVKFKEDTGPAHFSKAVDDFKTNLEGLDKLDIFKPATPPAAPHALETALKEFKDKKLDEKLEAHVSEFFKQMLSSEPVVDAKGTTITDPKTHFERLKELSEIKFNRFKTEFATELSKLQGKVEKEIAPEMAKLQKNIGKEAKSIVPGMKEEPPTELHKAVAEAESAYKAAVTNKAANIDDKKAIYDARKKQLDDAIKQLNKLQEQHNYFTQIKQQEEKRLADFSSNTLVQEMKRIEQSLKNDRLAARSLYQRTLYPKNGFALHRQGEKDVAVDQQQLLVTGRGIDKLKDGVYEAKDESYIKQGDGWRPIMSNWDKEAPGFATKYAEKYEKLMDRLIRDGGADGIEIYYPKAQYAHRSDIEAIFEKLERRMKNPAQYPGPIVPFKISAETLQALKEKSQSPFSRGEDPGSETDPNSLLGRINIYNAFIERNEMKHSGQVKRNQLLRPATDLAEQAEARKAEQKLDAEYQARDTAKTELGNAEEKLAKLNESKTATDQEKTDAKTEKSTKQTTFNDCDSKLDAAIKKHYQDTIFPDSKKGSERLVLAENEMEALQKRINELADHTKLLQKGVLSLNGDMKQQAKNPTLDDQAVALNNLYQAALVELKDAKIRLDILHTDIRIDNNYNSPALLTPDETVRRDATRGAVQAALEKINATEVTLKNKDFETQVLGMPTAVRFAAISQADTDLKAKPKP